MPMFKIGSPRYGALRKTGITYVAAVTLTQAAYDALPVKDPQIFYIING